MTDEMAARHAERRSARREPIRRPVVFAGVRGGGLLHQGMAVDISASGLLVHTSQPEVVGRHLELELHPDGLQKPGDVVMVRGEVVWVRTLDKRGDYAMGIRFMQSFPATDATGPGYRPATEAESRKLAAAIQRQLAAMEPAAQVEISDAARKRNAESARDTRKSRRALPLIVLLVLVAVVVSLLTLGALWGLGLLERSASPLPAPRPSLASEEEPADAAPDDYASESIVQRRIDEIESAGPSYFLNRGSLFLIQGRFPAAGQAFRTARSHEQADPIARFVATVGEPQALAASGDSEGALALLEDDGAIEEAVPEAWRQLKEEFRRQLLSAPDSPGAREPLVNAFAFKPAAREGAPTADSVDTRIEIDTTRHLLTLLKANEIVAVYPIGLGARGRTPEGEFAVINKIEDPVWYNGGDAVPAGAPENELGSRWIGLGDEAGPTPIGIHATDDLGSIGGNESRGCIRMRPADVEALFRHVAVGTTVRIRAL